MEDNIKILYSFFWVIPPGVWILYSDILEHSVCSIFICGVSRKNNRDKIVRVYKLPTSISIVFSVQGTGDSPTGPDPENRVGDQDIRSPGKPFSSGLQVPGEPFPSWSG
jgi:hypothetical protein